jgi:type IV secretion system protein VirB1
MAEYYQMDTTRTRLSRPRPRGLGLTIAGAIFVMVRSAHAQGLPIPTAARLAAEHGQAVDTGTLLAFAYHESRLRPFAIHDNTVDQSVFPASAAEAASLARARLAQGHSLDLGIMQVNSDNLARTGLTVTTVFNAGESMRAGALILTAAYRQCLYGNDSPNGAEQQAALRCAASIYNTGREQAGILNGYQADVWRAAAQIVPAIQFSGAGALRSPPVPEFLPEGVVTPEPGQPPPGLEDALHPAPPVSDSNDELSDALHLTKGKDTP